MSKTILIVDDSPSLRQTVSITLKKEGYQVLESGDGKEALEQMDGKKINLIISDINMPIMDGITMVKEIKKLPNYKYTPIIMLTTESGSKKMQEGKDAGVRAWMVKPFRPMEMLDAVSKLVAL
jgi:two-component system chemotaxis response regulator CheY